MVRNKMKSGQPFFVTISVDCPTRSDRGDSAKRCEQEKKQLGGGVGVRARKLGVSSSPSPSFPLYFFLSLSSFAPHSTIRTPGTDYNFHWKGSAPPPQLETLLFDWF